jgi:hypothetical protein
MHAIDLTLTVDRPMPGAEIRVTGKLRDRAYAEVNEAFEAN